MVVLTAYKQIRTKEPLTKAVKVHVNLPAAAMPFHRVVSSRQSFCKGNLYDHLTVWHNHSIHLSCIIYSTAM